MSKISNPAAPIAVVAALVLSGIGAGLPIDSARADNTCLAAPNAAAPEGQHWYYRLDRQKHAKCWYLHATMRLLHHAVVQGAVAPEKSMAEPAASAQAERAPPPAADDAPTATSSADAAQAEPQPQPEPQPEPHVTVLTVKTVTTPFVDTPTEPQPGAPANVNNTPPAAQTLPRRENATSTRVRPANGPESAPVKAAAEARHAPAQSMDAANTDERGRSADMLLLLALALGIAAILIGIATKIANQYRAPRLSDHPDDVWMRYRAAHPRFDDPVLQTEQDVPFLGPQAEPGLAKLHEQEWIEQSLPAHAEFPAQFENDDPTPGEQPRSSLRNIELALRVLRQARQSRVA